MSELIWISDQLPVFQANRNQLSKELFIFYFIMHPFGYNEYMEVSLNLELWQIIEEGFLKSWLVEHVLDADNAGALLDVVRFDFNFRLNENILYQFKNDTTGLPTVLTQSIHVPLEIDYFVDLAVLQGMKIMMDYSLEYGCTGYQLLELISNNVISVENRPLLFMSYKTVINHLEQINSANRDFIHNLNTANDLWTLDTNLNSSALYNNPVYAASLLFIGGVTFLAMWHAPDLLCALDLPMNYNEGV